MADDDERERVLLARKMPGLSPDEVDAWLALDDRRWVTQHGPDLHAAGLSAQDATDLFRRLGPEVAPMIGALIIAGRMADIDNRYIHLWAASGLMKPALEHNGRPGSVRTFKFTRWVTEARRYITVCGGDQHLAALSAAAGLSVEETVTMRAAGDLVVESLEMLSALREGNRESTS